jgi:2-polyprenyl-3-methyl-5-hydroxy-6-metoxy-1,4-benzoquinol methylase
MPMTTDPLSFHGCVVSIHRALDQVGREAECGVSEDDRVSHDEAVGEVLSTSASREYWNTRHGSVDDLRSGGSLAYDRATNAMLYAVRQARLIEALSADSDPDIPRRVLDAGCGRGEFSRALTDFGHRVDGIDTSTVAITECRRRAIGRDSYSVSSLRSWRPPYLYDAVVCVDVLFHLMDDDEWSSSLRNLAALVRLGGRLVVADHDSEEDKVWGNYQKTRARSRYARLLHEQGLEIVDFIRNDFKSDQVGMHVAARVA